MKIRFPAFAAVALLALWACSDAAHGGLVPAASAGFSAESAPVADPPYGTPYGIGGTFTPFEVPGI